LKLIFTTSSKLTASKCREFLISISETKTGNHAVGHLYCIIGTVRVTGQSQSHVTWFYLIHKKTTQPKPDILAPWLERDNRALLDYYVESSSNFLSTFWNNPWRWRPIGWPETSVRNCHYSLCNNPEERSSRLLPGVSLKLLLVIIYLITG